MILTHNFKFFDLFNDSGFSRLPAGTAGNAGTCLQPLEISKISASRPVESLLTCLYIRTYIYKHINSTLWLGKEAGNAAPRRAAA